MLFGISVLFVNSIDRCTGISVSVVQGFIRYGAVQGSSNGRQTIVPYFSQILTNFSLNLCNNSDQT